MFKQLIFVRKDLGGDEKFRDEQITSASLSAGTQTMNLRKMWFDIWVANQSPKEIINVESASLITIGEKLKTMSIPFAYVYFKQMPTSLGIGPASDAVIEKIKGFANDKTSNTY